MNNDEPNDTSFEMNSRNALIEFIYSLQNDLKEHPEKWENNDLHTYLGALAGFLHDAHGYYRNAKLNIDADIPSWHLIADCLQAAAVYE